MNFRDKKVLVMGLGLHGGGVETVKFLLKEGAGVTVTDLRTKKELAPSLHKLKKHHGIRYVLGGHKKRDFLECDLVVKNPGVAPDSPLLTIAKKGGIPIVTDVGIFFDRFPGKIIGITGTRGKSTCAYLIWLLLRKKMRGRVHLGGNIRLSVLPILSAAKTGDYAVLELSSFQLDDLSREDVPRRSPEIAVLTNIFPDHLNWHKTFKNYLRAKSYIFTFQKKEDYLFANLADKTVKKLVRGANSRVIFPSLPQKFRRIVSINLGNHYEVVVALALVVAEHFGVSRREAEKVLRRFRGLPGREEEIRVVRGVRFVNDTTATIPEAAIAALERFGRNSKDIVLIAGGSDKKLDFREFAKKIREKVRALVLLAGDASEKLRKELGRVGFGGGEVLEEHSMKEAVKNAFERARKGDTLLLSPGAASFGLFLNEFDRGDKFSQEVRRLK